MFHVCCDCACILVLVVVVVVVTTVLAVIVVVVVAVVVVIVVVVVVVVVGVVVVFVFVFVFGVVVRLKFKGIDEVLGLNLAEVQGGQAPQQGPVVGFARASDIEKVNNFLAIPEVKANFPRDLLLLS